MREPDLSQIVDAFTQQIVILADRVAAARIQVALDGAFGPAKRGPGRPPKAAQLSSVALLPETPSRRRKKVLCPVPGCKNVAAPVFGMVCRRHKDVPKARIANYRKARRKAKARS